jgi:DNA-binding NarL/FixJ family response regulator
LIRVGILADTSAGERRFAELLAEEACLEIIEMDSPSGAADHHSGFVDVVVTAGLALEQMPGAVPVIALTELDMPVWGQNVHAWLPLNATVAEIVAAILAASCDLTVLTKSQARRSLGNTGVTRETPNQMVEMLTTRELEVLRMLADGLSNKEIATRLSISDHTAKFHVTQIFGKLGAASRAEATAIGIRRGFIPI